MNERIKQLAEQAGFQYIKEDGIGWAGNHSSSLPKFAELIIKDKDQHIKWLEDRLAHQEEMAERAMEMAHKLMGKLKDPKEWKGLTPDEIDSIIEDARDPMDALIQTMDQLRENNT